MQIMIRATAAMIVALMALAPVGAAAQTTETAAAPADSAGEDPVGLGAEVVAGLSQAEETFAARMTQIQETLDQTRTDIENAEPLFDQMIAAIEEQAQLGDPTGAFVESLEAYIRDIDALADEAERQGDTEIAADLRKTAQGFETARDRTIKIHSDSFRLIREIKADKRRFIIRKQAKLAAKALTVAEEGVKRLQGVLNEIREIRATVPTSTGVSQ